MKTIDIHTQTQDCRIIIVDSFPDLELYVKSKRTVIITDNNVSRFYRHFFPAWDIIETGSGETVKTLDTVEFIYNKLLDLEIDRSCFILGIGGGIVCDITGFAASTYMRGIPFGFVSSTLLSQVDASIGGKNGVNFRGFKNMIGVFNQPSFVICNTRMLETLPRDEFINGFGEIVKYAAIGDRNLFSFLEENYENALALDKNVLERCIYDCLIIKSSIVEKDEKESNERRKLNFGHTIGHALESITGLKHGEAVSIGMVFAANLSVRRNLLTIDEAKRLIRLLSLLGLPTHVETDKEKIKDAVRKDKKREGKNIRFVLLKSIGEAIIQEITLEELEEVIDNDMR
jgi:3-dehydroquinate synthase